MTPRLSILVPFYRDDPSVLLRSLDAQSIASESIEVLVMDDGSGDPGLTRRVEETISAMTLPARLMTAMRNRGRAATRNALQEAAKADWILFLDADMRIDKPDFLALYLDHIERGESDILFGGFSVEEKAADRDTDLHRALSHVSDCLDAAARNRHGAQHVASSNLCIRKAVLEDQPFDNGFQGWGWEDSEWAARVAQHYRLTHIDNPAVHLGLESTDTLLSRFATSGPNYRRFVQAHPELATSLPLYRIVNRLKHFPGQALVRQPLRLMVRLTGLPTRLRVMALKLWRASHYAEAMK